MDTNRATTECIQGSFEFQGLGSRRVEADFTGGQLSTDGGTIVLREIEGRHGTIRRLAKCFTDLRTPELIEHEVEALLGQRIYGLCAGYEDLNDHDELRKDPLLALVCNKEDVTGQNRQRREDKGCPLAGKSTLNRLELSAKDTDGRYKKILANPAAVEQLLISEGVKAIARRSRTIVLDFDATDDPLHGDQEGKYFHGYYKNHCYLPLYCFCGNIPLLARLRDCKRDGSEGTVEAAEKIVRAIRARFGKHVRIILRADSGFCRDEIMAWCEQRKNVFYCFGFAKNDRLIRELETTFTCLHQALENGQAQRPCRAFAEFTYRTIDSWSRERRVVGKAEVLEKGDNPRFVVTNLSVEDFSAQALYEQFYCARGDMENRIKEQQQDLFADRTSSYSFDSNQLRLWFSAFAHLLMEQMRADVLMGTSLEKATLGTIRLRLLKIAVRVTVSCRRIYLQFTSAFPLKADFARIHAALAAG